MLGLLHDAISPDIPFATSLEPAAATRRLAAFAAILDGWGRLRAEPSSAESVPVVFLAMRVYNLRTVILDFGFDPDSLEMLMTLAGEDATIAAELLAVIDELQFLLVDLAREIDRRMPEWRIGLDTLAELALEDWRRQLDECIHCE